MKLILQVKGKPIPVSNYARTQENYTKAFQQAWLSINFLRNTDKDFTFEEEFPGVTLSHLVLMGKK